MKVKDLVKKNGVDEKSFLDFLEEHNLPFTKSIFSGASIEDSKADFFISIYMGYCDAIQDQYPFSGEQKDEMNIRIGQAVAQSCSEKELEEFDSLSDANEIQTWIKEKCPDYNIKVKNVVYNMVYEIERKKFMVDINKNGKEKFLNVIYLGQNDWVRDENINIDNSPNEFFINAFVINESESIKTKNARISFNIKNEGNYSTVTATITCDNMENPVTNILTFNSDSDFGLEYVKGSAFYYSDKTNFDGNRGLPLGDDIMSSSGTVLGYESLNGELLPSREHYITLSIKLKIYRMQEKIRSTCLNDYAQL